MAIKPQEILTEEKIAAIPVAEQLTAQQRKQRETKDLKSQKEILEEERIYREGVVSIKDLIAPAAMPFM